MALPESRPARPPGQTERSHHRARRSGNRIVDPRYVIGIDLGTTNCSLAYTDSSESPVTLMPVPQLVNPGEVREEPLLASSLYLYGAMDFPEGSLALPWESQPDSIVGRLAQKRGVENAGRLVSSAKSWLSQAGV